MHLEYCQEWGGNPAMQGTDRWVAACEPDSEEISTQTRQDAKPQ